MIAAVGIIAILVQSCTAEASTSAAEPTPLSAVIVQSVLRVFDTLWSFALVRLVAFFGVAALVAPRVYRATRLPRTVSLTHWAGATLAHRGYRSEAQQANTIVASRRTSRANSAADLVNPLAIAASSLTAQTIGVESPAALSSAVRSRSASRATGQPSSELGSDYNIPENSMLAFIYAHEQGAHGVEVDVALSKDGHIIVMHDNTFERTMHAKGEVADFTLEEVRAMKYRRVTDREYIIREPRNRLAYSDQVPTLEQVILFCKERGLKLMIESKEYADYNLLRRKISEFYDKYEMHSWAFVASFNAWHIYWFRREYPLIPTALLYCRTCTEWYHEDSSKEMLLPDCLNYAPVRAVADWFLWYLSPTLLADWMGVAIVGPHNILISPALVASLTARGILCDVWTVNSAQERDWLKSLGCVVTTDRLFSHDDKSPFDEKRAADKSEDTNVHAAEELIADSYYTSNPQLQMTVPVSTVLESERSDQEEVSPSSKSSDSDIVLVEPAATATE